MASLADLQSLVQTAARALGKAGLVHAFGHCSVRINAEQFLVSAPLPLATITHEPGAIVPVEGDLPPDALGEVRAHQAIYARRSDVAAICRIMPPTIMSLSTQGIVPQPRHGIGAYFHPGPVFWDDPRLLRDDVRAAALAEALGRHNAIIMRGNGAIVCGESLEQAVTLSWFLEDAARVERDVRAMGCDPASGLLSAEDIAARQIWSGGVVERMWRYLTANI